MRIYRCLAIMILALFICGCQKETYNDEPHFKRIFGLDTVSTITIYDDISDEKAGVILDHCATILKDYENMFSKTIDTSDVSKINKHMDFRVNKDSAYVISKAIDYSKKTDGAFDISIAPLTELWHLKAGTVFIPDKEDIEKTKTYVDYKKIKVDKLKVSLPKNSKIDLGGIAKGYIGDKIKEYLKSRNIKSAIINLGGNILTVGTKPGVGYFNIGLDKPFKENEFILTFKTKKDVSVVTSGNGYRYFKYKGKIYHHILDPKTGYNPDNNLLSTTIISNKSIDGDAYSTATYVLGLKKGMEFIEKNKDLEAVFIDKNYKIHLSSGLKLKDDVIIIKKTK